VANIKSQIKRIRTNNKAQDRNKAYRSALRTAIRKFRDAVTSGDAAKIKSEFTDASRSLEQQTKSQRWPSWPTKLAFVNFLDTSKA